MAPEPIFQGCVVWLLPGGELNGVRWCEMAADVITRHGGRAHVGGVALSSLPTAQTAPTHVVAGAGLAEFALRQALNAAAAAVPVLEPAWLAACVKGRTRVPLGDYTLRVQQPVALPAALNGAA